MQITARTFRVFVSSTFSDLNAERNHLQDDVFPRLRDLCQQPWLLVPGDRPALGRERGSGARPADVNIYVEALRRCQSTSPRPNFIVLLGQRYGLALGPVRIAKAREHIRVPRTPR